MNSDGHFVYQHDGSFVTSDVFSYEAADFISFPSAAMVMITIIPEPSAVVLLGIALILVRGRIRQRRSA